jgi:3D (Asp-Asp-Asp) domain-containing protein
MDFHRQSFDLLHRAVVAFTIPIALFSLGMSKTVRAGQKPNSEKSQELPLNKPADSMPALDLPRSLSIDIVNRADEEQCQQDSEVLLFSVLNNVQQHLNLRQSIIADIPIFLSQDQPVEAPKDEIEPQDVNKDLRTFVATAYCIKNTTACGVMVRTGIIAADPGVLPLGSIVKIDAGKYSGIYRVLDTGPGVRGNHVDIYMPCRSEAIIFGRRKVQIEIVRYGWGNDQIATGE